MKNPAIHSPGVPSAESSAGMVAHRKRVAEENALSETRHYADGETVLVRASRALTWHKAVVLAAWHNREYGWAYRVRHLDGSEEKVTGQRVRKAKQPRRRSK